MEGYSSCFDQMQYFGQYLVPNGQLSSVVMGMSTRNNSQAGSVAHQPQQLQRGNSKNMKSTPKGTVLQQTVKNIRQEAI